MRPIEIVMTISEPWDVGEAAGWLPIKARVIQVGSRRSGGSALVQLESPITYRGVCYRHAIATPRFDGQDFSALSSGRSLSCAITGISEQQAQAVDPLDIGDWRGGLAFVGDIDPAG
jgi:hypothetical protein